MKFYRLKQRVFQAIQWKEPEKKQIPYTGWDTRPDYEGVFWTGNSAIIDTPNGTQTLKQGDWIMPTENKKIVYSHQEFVKNFEPVDPSENLS